MAGRPSPGIWKMKRDVKAIFISGYTADIIADKGLVDSDFHLLTEAIEPGGTAQESAGRAGRGMTPLPPAAFLRK